MTKEHSSRVYSINDDDYDDKNSLCILFIIILMTLFNILKFENTKIF